MYTQVTVIQKHNWTICVRILTWSGHAVCDCSPRFTEVFLFSDLLASVALRAESPVSGRQYFPVIEKDNMPPTRARNWLKCQHFGISIKSSQHWCSTNRRVPAFFSLCRWTQVSTIDLAYCWTLSEETATTSVRSEVWVATQEWHIDVFTPLVYLHLHGKIVGGLS